MKRTIILTLMLTFGMLPFILVAQNGAPNITIKKDGDKTIIIREGKELDLEDLEDLKGLQNQKKLKIEINKDGSIDSTNPDAPFIGIYPADLDFPKAQSLNYPYNYGVLVTGVVPNSPAYKYRIIEDDIIMEIKGKKVLNLKEFDKLKSYYRAGDTVPFTIWRNGESITIDFTFGSKEKKEISLQDSDTKTSKKKISVGGGGGGFDLFWSKQDMTDVNTLLRTLKFSEVPEDGLISWGFSGKGNVGKGIFLGGEFRFFDLPRKTNDGIYTNTINYNMFIGGATLEKRIPITKNVISSVGFLLGGGTHNISILHSDGNYHWPTGTTATTDSIMGTNSFATLSKGYLVVHPRVEVMYRVLSWLGLRAQAGYLYGYSPLKGWTVSHMEESYDIKNSPDTPFQSFTILVGPWFGF